MTERPVLVCDWNHPVPCGAEAEYILSAPGTGLDARVCGDADHLQQVVEAKLNAIPDDISVAPYVRVYRA